MPGVIETGAGQQQPARAPHQPPVGQRHRQRAELAWICGGQRLIQPPPPGRITVERGEHVDKLGHPELPDAEYCVGGMPGRPLDQAVQHWGEVTGEARKGWLQDDRITRRDSLAAMLRGGKERRLLPRPRRDHPPHLRIQLAQPDRTRDQIEQAIPGPGRATGGREPRRPDRKEAGEWARCDVTAIGTEGKGSSSAEAKWFISQRECVHDSTDALGGGRPRVTAWPRA